MKRLPPRAFTLVELLVTVGIIVILMALLFPVATSFQEQSKSTKCSSNLRRLGQAAMDFSADNNNALIAYGLNRPHVLSKYNNVWWYGILYYYLDYEDPWVSGDVLAVKMQNKPNNPFYCPKKQKNANGENAAIIYTINRISGWNNSSTAAGRDSNPFQNFLRLGQGIVEKTQVSTSIGRLDAGKPYFLPGGLSKTALLADRQMDGDAAFTPENVGTSLGFHHRDHGNVLFMDGHVESIKNPDFTNNPKVREESQWIDFLGRPPQ